jgi:hypothetical protein
MSKNKYNSYGSLGSFSNIEQNYDPLGPVILSNKTADYPSPN